MSNKKLVYVGMLLVGVTSALAYHSGGSRSQVSGSGEPLSGTTIFLIFAGAGLTLFMAWRWWKNLK